MQSFSPTSQRLLIAGLCVLFLGGCKPQTGDARAAFERGNYERARELWLPAAEAGDAQAQNALGTLYYLGLGVRRDDDRALQWFEQAARQGHPGAQRNTGMMYMDGRGTRQDFVTAYMWFYAADKQGNKGADAYLGNLVNKLTPNQQIKARRDAAPFIVHPTADYVPEPIELPEANPRIQDHRETG